MVSSIRILHQFHEHLSSFAAINSCSVIFASINYESRIIPFSHHKEPDAKFDRFVSLLTFIANLPLKGNIASSTDMSQPQLKRVLHLSIMDDLTLVVLHR